MVKSIDRSSAFPVCNDEMEPEPGIDARDYFAAKAMAAILASNDVIEESDAVAFNDMQLIARRSYMMADAMLERRERVDAEVFAVLAGGDRD